MSGICQERPMNCQPDILSPFGFDLGETHGHGLSPQIRWALNFVAIYCLLRLDASKGYVAELKKLCRYTIDQLHDIYPESAFYGFQEGRLRDVAECTLGSEKVRRVLRKTIRINFQITAPILPSEHRMGFNPKLIDLDSGRVKEALIASFQIIDAPSTPITSFQIIDAPSRPKWVRQPGQWLTKEEWEQQEFGRVQLIFAPTCAKGERRV